MTRIRPDLTPSSVFIAFFSSAEQFVIGNPLFNDFLYMIPVHVPATHA